MRRPPFDARASIVLAAFCALASFSTGTARAQPARTVLRFATLAPDGTTWAHELRALGQEVERQTSGQVQIKWFFGGIAGDDATVGDRVARAQLDGVASGGQLCERLSPTLRVINVRGVFKSREEAAFVLNRMKPQIEDEFRSGGWVYVAATGLGPDLVFSRRPIRTFDELRRTRIYQWAVDNSALLFDRELGLTVVGGPVADAARLYDAGQIDALFSTPTAALAFQWSTLTRYVLSLPTGFAWGCLTIAGRAFDRLTLEQQQVVRAAGAKAAARIDELGRLDDDALLGGAFHKQGLTVIEPAPTLRAEFLTAAREVRDRLGDRLLPHTTLQQILALLADYRMEHGAPGGH